VLVAAIAKADADPVRGAEKREHFLRRAMGRLRAARVRPRIAERLGAEQGSRCDQRLYRVLVERQPPDARAGELREARVEPVRERRRDRAHVLAAATGDPEAAGAAATGVVRRRQRDPWIDRAGQEGGLAAARVPGHGDARTVDERQRLEIIDDALEAPGPRGNAAAVVARLHPVDPGLLRGVGGDCRPIEVGERVAALHDGGDDLATRAPPAQVATHDDGKRPRAVGAREDQSNGERTIGADAQPHCVFGRPEPAQRAGAQHFAGDDGRRRQGAVFVVQYATQQQVALRAPFAARADPGAVGAQERIGQLVDCRQVSRLGQRDRERITHAARRGSAA
jgi:hypothetical protein